MREREKGLILRELGGESGERALGECTPWWTWSFDSIGESLLDFLCQNLVCDLNFQKCGHFILNGL